jgi:hypothetical protein
LRQTHTALLKAVTTTPKTENNPGAVRLTLLIPKNRFARIADLGELMAYADHDVAIEITSKDLADVGRPVDNGPIFQTKKPEERSRPGPTETCRDCGKAIGDDVDAIFYAPAAGPPYPLCGACALKVEDREIAEERDGDDRAEFLIALGEGWSNDSPAYIAMLDGYDSRQPKRVLHARCQVGLDEDPSVTPELLDDPTYLEWLRTGEPTDLVEDIAAEDDESVGDEESPDLEDRLERAIAASDAEDAALAVADAPLDGEQAIPAEFRGDASAPTNDEVFEALPSASASVPVSDGRRGRS